MKTLYALALVCLSVPAFANELDFDRLPQAEYPTETGYSYDMGTDFYVSDENTATIMVPPAPKSEDYLLDLGLSRDIDSADDDLVELDAIPADAWF
jgi:hypothetical protein